MGKIGLRKERNNRERGEMGIGPYWGV